MTEMAGHFVVELGRGIVKVDSVCLSIEVDKVARSETLQFCQTERR